MNYRCLAVVAGNAARIIILQMNNMTSRVSVLNQIWRQNIDGYN